VNLKIKETLAKLLNFWADFATENTTDIWVPVTTGIGSSWRLQHRVIPPMIGTRITPTIQLADAVSEVVASSVECIQLNATEYLCVFTVRLRATRTITNDIVCRFRSGSKIFRPKGDCYNFPAKIGNDIGGGWWNGQWFAISDTWSGGVTAELYGSFVAELN